MLSTHKPLSQRGRKRNGTVGSGSDNGDPQQLARQYTKTAPPKRDRFYAPGLCVLGDLSEHIFAHATYRAHPIVGNILEGCTWRNPAIGISYLGVVHVTAGAFIAIHSGTSFPRVYLWHGLYHWLVPLTIRRLHAIKLT